MISSHIKSNSMFFKFDSISSGYNMIIIIGIMMYICLDDRPVSRGTHKGQDSKNSDNRLSTTKAVEGWSLFC